MVGAEVLGQVHRTQTAVLVGPEPLLAAGVGGLERVEVRHRVGAVGGIQKEHAGFAVVVGLFDDLLKEVAGAQGLVILERDAGGFGLLKGALEALGARGQRDRGSAASNPGRHGRRP